MRKFLYIFVILAAAVYLYFWYVRGVDLIFEHTDDDLVPPYSFATSLPSETESPWDGEPGPRWEVAEPMPTPRTGVGAAAVYGQVYVIGGVDSLARTLDAVEVFNTSNNSWKKAAPLPRPLHHPAVVTEGGKIYVIGGLEGFITQTPVDTMFEYDSKTGQWEELDPLPKPLGAAAAVVHDGLIHIFGGRGNIGPVEFYRVFDPQTGAWSLGEEMLVARDRLAAAEIEDRFYVVGGRTGSTIYNTGRLDSTAAESGIWERFDNMPTPRSDLSAESIDGLLYVFGGESVTQTFGSVEAYDPEAKKWSVVTEMPTPRHGLGTASVNGFVFLIGGGRKPGLSVSDVVEVFIP